MKNFTLLLSAFVVAFYSASGTPLPGTQFRNGPAHTGVYDAGEKFNGVNLHWQYKANGAIRSTPVVINGKVFFGSADHYLYCLDTAGRQLWKYKAEDAVHSSPALDGGLVFFNDRSNNLYAIKAGDGTLAWKKQLGKTPEYEWSFDYYIASPLVVDKIIYTGSGNGNLYAIDMQTGNIKWQFNARSIIRSTPAFHDGKLFFGDCNQHVYRVNAADGKLDWTFTGNGDTVRNEDFGFDRKAFIASPAISNNIVVIGDRAGYLYAINETSGKLIWQLDYQITWIISSVAIKDSMIVTGTSDGAYINAINLYSGKELWRFQTQGPVWASPIITGDNVICPSNDGVLFGLDLHTGKEIWRFYSGERFFSSPVISGNKLYAANDNGSLYCFTAAQKNTEVVKAVFWMKDPPFQYFQYGLDRYIKDYFRSWGYEGIDEKSISTFMQSRLGDHKKSVIVFATNYFPATLMGDSANPALLLNYLQAGGKTVICGLNPAIYKIDTVAKQVTALDFTAPNATLKMKYPYNDTRTFNGYYPAEPTMQGRQWGLKTNYVSRVGIPVSAVDIPLMVDETGKATSWVKTYGGPVGSGFVQTWITPATLTTINEIKELAEYGL